MPTTTGYLTVLVLNFNYLSVVEQFSKLEYFRKPHPRSVVSLTPPLLCKQSHSKKVCKTIIYDFTLLTKYGVFSRVIALCYCIR